MNKIIQKFCLGTVIGLVIGFICAFLHSPITFSLGKVYLTPDLGFTMIGAILGFVWGLIEFGLANRK